MKFSFHLCLALMLLGGNLPSSAGMVWGTGCSTSDTCPENGWVSSSADHASTTQACCEMACCQDQPAISLKTCCQKVVEKPETNNSADESSPVPSTSDRNQNCPCCPGNCCLANSGPIFCVTPSPTITTPESVGLLLLTSDGLDSRRDEPALPPPRILSLVV